MALSRGTLAETTGLALLRWIFGVLIVLSGSGCISTSVEQFDVVDGDGVAAVDPSLPYPVVVSVVRGGTNPTKLTSLAFNVKFSKGVMGVDSPDFVVQCSMGACSIGSVISTTSSDWVVTVNVPAIDGTVRLDVVDDDSIQALTGEPLGGEGISNGDFATGQVYTADHTPPGAPVALSLTVTENDPGTNDTLSGVPGAVEGSVQVRVYKEIGLTTLLGSRTANADGSFAAFSIGDNQATGDQVYVVAVDAAGNQSPSTTMTNDASAPGLPATGSISLTQNAPPASDTVFSAGGAVEGSTYIKVYREAALTTLLGSALAASDGSFDQFSIGNNQATDDWVYVVAEDAAGNRSSAVQMFNDATAPAAPVVAQLFVAMNAPGANDTVAGTAGAVEAGATVRVYSDAALTDEIGFTTAILDGSFGEISIGDNLYGTVYVVAVDAVGNRSAYSAKTNDITGPTIDGTKISVTVRNPGTNDQVTGSAGAVTGGSLVRVFNDSATAGGNEIGNGVVNGDGSFGPISIGDNQADASDLVYIVAYDGYGNPSVKVAKTNDITPPAAPVAAKMNLAMNAPPSSDYLSGTDGAAEPGSTVRVYSDAGLTLHVISGVASGTGSFPTLSLGDNTAGIFYIVARDAAGNVSTATTKAHDIVAPAAPILANLSVAMNPPGSQDVLSGSGIEAGAKVRVYPSDPGLGPVAPLGFTTADGLGDFSSLYIGSNACGTCYVTATDDAGNESAATTVLNDIVGPTVVTFAKRFDQLAPARTLPVNFTVTFSEPIAPATFDVDGPSDFDITLDVGSTASGITWTKSTSDNQVFTISAIAVQYPGALKPKLGAGLVTDAAGNPNTAGTSSDIVLFGLAPRFTQVGTGVRHTCGLTSEGRVYCTGSNTLGQLGDGSVADSAVPVEVDMGNVTEGAFTQLAVGHFHTCGLTAKGQVYCWGENALGQIGNGGGGGANVLSPEILSSAPAERFVQITAGGAHTCGLTSVGTAYCWGDDSSGQLGKGIVAAGDTPGDPVAGGHVFTQLTAGAAHTCGVTKSGVAYCWGDDTDGQIGNGTPPAEPTSYDSPSVVDVTPLSGSNFVVIAAGGSHTCALDSEGDAWCWGADGSGQLGNGAGGASHSPVAVLGSNKFQKLALGASHSCGITGPGGAFCWGGDSGEQLGDAATGDSPSPTSVDSALITTWIDIAAGDVHGCGISGDGALFCWGTNDSSQLGNGDTTTSQTPVAASDDVLYAKGPSWLQISAGTNHSCGIKANGDVFCWGSGAYGQLGHGNTSGSTVPVSIDVSGIGGAKFVEIGVGVRHSCGLTSTGDIYCWGGNTYGQLGNGSSVNTSAPVALDVIGVKFIRLAVGQYHSCAVSDGHLAYCWGMNEDGQIGDGAGGPGVSVLSPTVVTGFAEVVQVTAGYGHSCAIDSTGDAHCWGNNNVGQLGTNSTTPAASPAPVNGSHKFIQISATAYHTCAITADSAAYCWGQAAYYQLGDGQNMVDRLVPFAVNGSLKFVRISAGRYSTCGITESGDGYCWGSDSAGQLGNGSNGEQTSPTLDGMIDTGGMLLNQVSAGMSNHSCGITASGRAVCWGSHSTGQLGNGEPAGGNQVSPVSVKP